MAPCTGNWSRVRAGTGARDHDRSPGRGCGRWKRRKRCKTSRLGKRLLKGKRERQGSKQTARDARQRTREK